MLLASVFFALMNVSVKFIPHIPAIEIVWFRSVFSAVFTVLVLRQKGIPLFGTHKLSLVARGIVGSISLILFFFTLQRIPLATAVTLQYLSPIFTTILGIFILKEKVRARQFVYFHCFRSTAVSGKPFEIVKRLIPLYKIVGAPNFREFSSICFYLTLSIGKKIRLI
jgi:EamA domain-containing membrane protein RarD